MNRHLTTIKSVAAAGVLALGLAACGQEAPEATDPLESDSAASAQSDPSEGTGGDASDGGVAASGDTAAEDGGRDGASADGPLSEEEFLPALQQAVEGKESVTTEMVVEVEGAPMTVTGVVDMAAQNPAMEMTMTAGGGTMAGSEMHLVMVDGSMYLSVPGLTGEGQYLAVDSGDPMLGSAENLSQQMNPEHTWQQWQSGMMELEYVGEESVEGEDLHHYIVHVDGEAAVTPPEQDSSGEMAMAFDVWLDQDNLMRQMTTEVAGTSAQIRMSGWGEEVTIEAPEASAIVDSPLGSPQED